MSAAEWGSVTVEIPYDWLKRAERLAKTLEMYTGEPSTSLDVLKEAVGIGLETMAAMMSDDFREDMRRRYKPE